MTLAQTLVLVGFLLPIGWNAFAAWGLLLCVRDREVTSDRAMRGIRILATQSALLLIACGVAEAIIS